MRMLFVTPTLPIPTSGGRTRIYNLIKQLSAGHEISVASFVQPGERGRVEDVRPHCEHLELIPFDGFESLGKWRNRLHGWRSILFSQQPRYVRTFPVERMRAPLRHLVRERSYDLVVFESLLLVELASEIGSVSRLLVEQNVESDIARRSLALANNPVHKLRDWLMWRKLLRFEKEWVQCFPVCVTVSERDADRVREMAPETELHVVPNGVDVRHFAPNEHKRDANTLLFFGTLNYAPNVDGLLWFCAEIWPRIRAEMQRAKLEVVGIDPSPQVLALDDLPDVRITGFVPDIREKLWSATICVVPLRVGGGTRLKILEALAAGCPVISTTVGAEGLSVIDGEHLLVRDAPVHFAAGIVELLESRDLRQRLALAGRLMVQQRYDWQSIGKLMHQACARAVHLGASTGSGAQR